MMKILKLLTAIVLLSGIFIATSASADTCKPTHAGRAGVEMPFTHTYVFPKYNKVLCMYEEYEGTIDGYQIIKPFRSTSGGAIWMTIHDNLLACGVASGGSAKTCIFNFAE